MHKSQYLPASAFEAARWQKATASEPQQGCVEFTKVGKVIAVRDSKVPDGPILQFTEQEVHAMLTGAKAGEFDHLV